MSERWKEDKEWEWLGIDKNGRIWRRSMSDTWYTQADEEAEEEL